MRLFCYSYFLERCRNTVLPCSTCIFSFRAFVSLCCAVSEFLAEVNYSWFVCRDAARLPHILIPKSHFPWTPHPDSLLCILFEVTLTQKKRLMTTRARPKGNKRGDGSFWKNFLGFLFTVFMFAFPFAVCVYKLMFKSLGSVRFLNIF